MKMGQKLIYMPTCLRTARLVQFSVLNFIIYGRNERGIFESASPIANRESIQTYCITFQTLAVTVFRCHSGIARCTTVGSIVHGGLFFATDTFLSSLFFFFSFFFLSNGRNECNGRARAGARDSRIAARSIKRSSLQSSNCDRPFLPPLVLKIIRDDSAIINSLL